MSEDERTEEQYLRILLSVTWSRFDVTIENSSSGLWESSIIERVARGWLSVMGASQCVNCGRQQLRFQENNPGGVIS